MRELVRADTKQPLHEYLIQSVNVGLAARTLNDVLECVEVSVQRERVALAIWNKLVPTLAAVAIDVRHEGPESVHDLNAMLISNGLDALPDTATLEHVPEKAE